MNDHAESASQSPDPSCIFCKIAAGQIPCYKVYEDEQVLSFLDIGPLSQGHTLVIPKAHYVQLTEMPESLVGHCMTVAARLSRAVMQAVGKRHDGWNILQNNGRVAGQVVDHVHFHIIPRCENDGLGFRWPAGDLAEDDAKQLLAAITAAL